MTEKQIRDAQNATFERYYNSADRNLSDRGRECVAFLAGWSAADAFADELSQLVTGCSKFGNPEQLNHIPDSAKMVRAQIAKDLYVGGLNHPDTDVRSWCYGHIDEHIKECIYYTNRFLAELDKTEEK